MSHLCVLYFYVILHLKYLGKGENIWDRLVHTRPEVITGKANGDVACDSYHKYKTDIALAKNLKVRVYFVN